jgi:hypothetical protein
MVNIARHHTYTSPDGGDPVIIDPFCGTGTTLLDAAVRFPNARVVGLDRDPFMPTLVKDNLQLFALDRDNIAIIHAIIFSLHTQFRADVADQSVDTNSTVARILCEADPKLAHAPNVRVLRDVFAYCFRTLIRELRMLDPSPNDTVLSDAAVSRLADRGFSDDLLTRFTSGQYGYKLRVVFFLLWRALLMNTFSIRNEVRTPKAIYNIFLLEVERCLKEYAALEQLLGREVVNQTRYLYERVGSYSHEGSINPSYIANLKQRTYEPTESQVTPEFIKSSGPGIIIAKVNDSIEALKRLEGVADIVITDPPYGFNTHDEGSDEIKRFYPELVPALVRVTKKRGQLMVALPAFAKNGKQIPFYQTRESVPAWQAQPVRHRTRAGCRRLDAGEIWVTPYTGEIRDGRGALRPATGRPTRERHILPQSKRKTNLRESGYPVSKKHHAAQHQYGTSVHGRPPLRQSMIGQRRPSQAASPRR